MLFAFEQRLDDYVGAPRVAAFSLSPVDAPQPDAVVKDFDMDCEPWPMPRVHESFRRCVGETKTCVVSVYFGKLDDQYGGAPVPVTCKRVGTALLDFEPHSLKEFVETGTLPEERFDPPVLSAKLRDLVWLGEAVRWPFSKPNWAPEGVEMLVGDCVTMSFFGEDMDDYSSPEFSDFRL
jgi:hypothetical protein